MSTSFLSRFSAQGKGNTFYACWPGDDEIRLKWDGHYIPVPSLMNIAAEGANFGPPKDAEKRPIPGAVAIRDVYTAIPGQARRKTFDAEKFCQGIASNKRALVERGLIIVEEIGDIPAALKEGRPLWEKERLRWAQQVVREELAHQKEQEGKGMPTGSIAPKNLDHLLEARELLERHRESQGKQVDVGALSALLTGEPAPDVALAPATTSTTAPPTTEIEDPDLGAQVWKQAEAAGVSLLKSDLRGLLANEAETIRAIRQKIAEAVEAA